MKKIITHDGLFHADEVFAIALLLETRYEVPIHRTRDKSAMDTFLRDPDVFVLDVGGEYDVVYHNFDHHQKDYTEGDATNMLVLRWLNANGYISNGLYEALLIPFKAISIIDINGYDGFNGYQVNSLIKSLNFVKNGWELALDLARSVIKAYVSRELGKERSLHIWNTALTVEGTSIKIVSQFPSEWKSYSDATFLIEDTQKDDIYSQGGIKVHSADATKFPIKSTGKETFLHKGRFLAAFNSIADAIECAKLSLDALT